MSNLNDKIYNESQKLALDFAQEHIEFIYSNVMNPKCKEISKNVRKMAELNEHQSDPDVQTFYEAQHIAYSVIYELFTGYKEYKLIKKED